MSLTPRQKALSNAWLVVLIALSVIVIMWGGTVAKNRWCGPDLCEPSRSLSPGEVQRAVT